MGQRIVSRVARASRGPVRSASRLLRGLALTSFLGRPLRLVPRRWRGCWPFTGGGGVPCRVDGAFRIALEALRDIYLLEPILDTIDKIGFPGEKATMLKQLLSDAAIPRPHSHLPEEETFRQSSWWQPHAFSGG